MKYIYRSYNQAADDIRAWCNNFKTDISAVCGVPRSGLFPAAIFAQEMGVECLPIEALMSDNRYAFRPSHSRKLPKRDGPVLILDDTSWNGRTMRLVREYLKTDNVVFGAVYSGPKPVRDGLVDVIGYRVDTLQHSFQWNLMRDCNTRYTMTDMDGVLCEDWGKPDFGDHLQDYENFLETVRPLARPTREFYAVVTARLEKYRRVTEKWLRAHGIGFQHLLMAPFNTPQARASGDGFSGFKARMYREHSESVRLFIESCPRQSQQIAKQTGFPVLCYSEQRLYNGTEPEPAW